MPIVLSPDGITKVSDIALNALKLLGIEEAGETSTYEDLNDGMIFLNLLLDEWSIDREKIYARSEDSIVMTVGKGAYTIGPGMDIDTNTPVKIEQGFLRNLDMTPYLDYPLNVTMLQEEYNDMPIKYIETIPTRLYYHTTWPTGTIYFDFLPIKAYELHLFSWKALTSFTDINQTIILPDGYKAALTYNLAVAFAPAFGKEAPASVSARAVMLSSKISAKNSEIPRIKLQGIPGSGGSNLGSIFNPFVRG